MRFVNVYCLCKHITAFTDRSYNIVCFVWLVARDVLNLVVCLIEGRADEVCHAGIDYTELFYRTLLYIQSLCYQTSALTNHCSTKFEVQMLVAAQIEMLVIALEILGKCWYRSFVRVLVVDAQAAANIDVLNCYSVVLESGLKLVYAVAQSKPIH